MSDDSKPTINISRGKRSRKRSTSASKAESTSGSGLGLGLNEVATGLASGVRNAWLAGLGALSMAEQVGSQVFDALVEEGKSWERQRRETTEAVAKKLDQLRGESAQVAEEAGEAAQERVRSEVNTALESIGVPSRSDLDDLRGQVEDLTDRLETLSAELQKEDVEG